MEKPVIARTYFDVPELTEYVNTFLESMAEIASRVTDFRDDLPPRESTMTGTLMEIDNEAHSDDWDDEC